VQRRRAQTPLILRGFELFYGAFERNRLGKALLGDELKQLLGAHLEPRGQLNDAVKLHICLRAFNAADVIPVDTTKLREFLLREIALFTQYTKLSAEQNQGAGHAL
jgi:hypothetical protein